MSETKKARRSPATREPDARFYQVGRRRVIGQTHFNKYLAQVEREPITESQPTVIVSICDRVRQ